MKMSSRMFSLRTVPLPRIVGGFFATRPDLFGRLVPVPGLLTRGQIAVYRENPELACADVNDILNTAAREYRGNTERGDDPHERLEPILRLENPLAPALDMLCDMAKQRPDDPSMLATWLRRESLVHICTQKGLRRGTLRALTCGKGGHLRFERGTLKLRVEAEHFKNRNADRFKNGKMYEEDLEDIHGCYDTFDRYLYLRRTIIVPGSSDGYLFVARGSDRPMILNVLTDDVRWMTKRFLAEDGSGPHCMPDVVAFGPQGYRLILVTYFLKTMKDLLYAAEAVVDDPKTVYDHYARYTPTDIKRRLKEQWLKIKRLRDRSGKPGSRFGARRK
jgi:hypothetical protein